MNDGYLIEMLSDQMHIQLVFFKLHPRTEFAIYQFGGQSLEKYEKHN
jgi:hypothetical protein